MRRPFLTLVAALLLAIPLACGGSTVPKPVEPPPRVEEPRTEVQHPALQPETPDLVAPPPAYGNKVVMAGAAKTGDRL
jgi:hypothetical protein